MPRRARITVLCEDKQHQTFIRQLLSRLGVNTRDCHFEPLPAGGSGEQYVRDNYPRLVKVHRSKAYQDDIGLAVMIDADTMEVRERKAELDDALIAEHPPKRQADEAVAIFVPRRNIETWIWNLRGESVNETDAYPKLDRESKSKDSVERLVEVLRNAPDSLRPLCASLQDGCEELERLPTLP